MIRLAALAFLLAAAPLAAQRAAVPAFSPAAFKAHVAFLSDDLLEGRDIGSRGHEIAARYVAARFAAMGLTPAGTGGSWFQPITFQETARGTTPGSVTVDGPAGTTRFVHGGDVLVGVNPLMLTGEVKAPLVFAGYGLDAPEAGLDDYRGLDVRGRIVVVLAGFPAGLPAEEAAHLTAEKRAMAEQRGAIGLIQIDTAASARQRPWAARRHFADGKSYNWIGANGRPDVEGAGVRLTASADTAAAEALFAGAPTALAAVLADAAKPGARPRGFVLRTSATIAQAATARTITSPNVAALLPGSDPTLKDEYVVLSAHLDHIGITPAKPGDKHVLSDATGGVEGPGTDRINNGALDNAAGIATMLEVADAMAHARDRPRRSVVFLASTGEEKGLLGADYYAQNPTVPATRIVGNVDLDMPLLLYRFTDVTAFGSDHSTLGPIVAAAVKPMGIALSPDPMPEETIFVRSDHYKFVRQGVPAVFLATGFANGGADQWHRFLNGNYHHPGDDISQKIDWVAGARFAEANYRITRAIADADQPPRWYAGDFFGDLFAPKAAKAPPPR